MPKVDVVDLNRKKVGEINLADEVFAVPVREHLHWEVVKAQQASKRAGTHSTKGRAAVSGGGKKPWKQKGTGRARQGSTRASQWVGGGKAFGPHPRDYSYSPTKQTRRAALCSVLSLRLNLQSLIVVDNFGIAAAKTKVGVGALATLGVKSVLLIENAENTNAWRALKNLKNVKVLAVGGLNVVDVLRYDNVILTRETVKQVEEVLTR